MPDVKHTNHRGVSIEEVGAELRFSVDGHLDVFEVENQGEAVDHADAIEQAYADAVANGGGIVRFPFGRFGVSSVSIDWAANVHVAFEGHGALASTFVKLGGDSDPIFHVYTDTAPPNVYATWGKFGMDGNNVAPGFVVTRLNRWMMRDVQIGTCSDAFVSDGALGYALENVVVGDSERGYVFRRAAVTGGNVYSNAITLFKCEGHANTVAAIDAEYGAGIHIGKGCIFEGNGTAGDDSTGAIIVRNTFADEFGLGNFTMDGVHLEINKGWAVQVDGGGSAGTNNNSKPYLVMRDVQINAQEVFPSYTDHLGTVHTDKRLGVRVGPMVRGTNLEGVISNGDTILEVEGGDYFETMTRFVTRVPSDLAGEGGTGGGGTVDEGSLEINYIKSHLDTQAKIQAEIDRLGSTGGVVQIAPTEIELSYTATATGDVLTQPYCIGLLADDGPIHMLGTPGVTSFVLADAQPGNTIPILLRGSIANPRTNRTRLEGFKIDGNSAGQTNVWGDFGLFTVSYAPDAEFVGLHLVNPNHFGAQIFRSSHRFRVENCLFDMAAEQLRTEVLEGRVFNNRFIMPTGDGVGLSLAANADIGVTSTNIMITGNQFKGGFAHVGGSGAQRCVIAQNTFNEIHNLNGYSIVLQHYDGSEVFSSLDNIVANNVFYDVRNGVKFGGNSSLGEGAFRNKVVNNTFVDGPGVNAVNAVWESSDQNDWNVATGNTVYGFSTPFSSVGANSDISAANNIVVT